MSDLKTTRITAMNLLARREHSRAELRLKLKKRDIEDHLIDQTIDQLSQEGLQSNSRFAENYSNSRAKRGYGPIRIAKELHERGIDDVLQETALAEVETDWSESAKKVREKRFGSATIDSLELRAKITRFLEYRGFSSEQIKAALA